MVGRPSDYSEELASEICAKMIEGESLRSICRSNSMPSASSVFLWLTKHPSFSEQYAKAQKERSTAMFEEMLDIADEADEEPSSIAKARLQVDTRKWALSRMNPKKYGDKVEQTLQGPDGGPVELQKIERVIVE